LDIWHENSGGLNQIFAKQFLLSIINHHEFAEIKMKKQSRLILLIRGLTPVFLLAISLLPACVSAGNSTNITSGNTLEIKDIAVSDITEYTVTVTWKTNFPSTSLVIAHKQDSINTIASWPETELVKNHKVVLENMDANSIYTLEVKSKDSTGFEVIAQVPGNCKTKAIRNSTDLRAGDMAPDFSLSSFNGKTVKLASYQGKNVMLVFWLTTCDACAKELPILESFSKNPKYSDFTLITLNIGGDKTVTQSYIESHKYTFMVLLDPKKAVNDQYTIAIYPTTFLLDTSGKIIKIRQEPFKNESEVTDFVSSPVK
jgi:peroxiredoxin